MTKKLYEILTPNGRKAIHESFRYRDYPKTHEALNKNLRDSGKTPIDGAQTIPVKERPKFRNAETHGPSHSDHADIMKGHGVRSGKHSVYIEKSGTYDSYHVMDHPDLASAKKYVNDILKNDDLNPPRDHWIRHGVPIIYDEDSDDSHGLNVGGDWVKMNKDDPHSDERHPGKEWFKNSKPWKGSK